MPPQRTKDSMQSNLIMFPIAKAEGNFTQIKEKTAIQYELVEQKFIELLEMEDLDDKLEANPALASEFEHALAQAIPAAYQNGSGDDSVHLFLQRILYRINRLKLFWYDDLRRYTNERSLYLRMVQSHIEQAWQQWELAQIDVEALQQLDVKDVKQALTERAAADLDPPVSEDSRYIREQITEAGYRRLVAIGSLNGLVEASQLSRTLGGVANEVQCVLTRLLMEEYGNGRLARKHSSFFTEMLGELQMQTEPEAYLDLIPWEVLAATNNSFLLTERKRYFLRYIGGLLYFEVSVPAGFISYQIAGERLGLPASAMSYWNLHIKVDILHGRWMLDDVALPLVEQYPDQAWELVLGYDQEKFMADRAGEAVMRSIREAEQTALAKK